MATRQPIKRQVVAPLVLFTQRRRKPIRHVVIPLVQSVVIARPTTASAKIAKRLPAVAAMIANVAMVAKAANVPAKTANAAIVARNSTNAPYP